MKNLMITIASDKTTLFNYLIFKRINCLTTNSYDELVYKYVLVLQLQLKNTNIYEKLVEISINVIYEGNKNNSS